MTAIQELTVEHLGSDATDDDLREFQRACDAALPEFDGDEQNAIDWVWNQGDFQQQLDR